jgi:hypothetical protein
MNRSRKGRAVPKLASGSTSQLPEGVARSSRMDPVMIIAAEIGNRSLKTTRSRIGATSAPQTATDEFDMVTRESSRRPAESRARSDENRSKELLRRSESPRTRLELAESDTDRSKRSMHAESVRHSEKESRTTPRSSERHETRSHESEKEERQSQGSSKRGRNPALGSQLEPQPIREFLTPKAGGLMTSATWRDRNFWGGLGESAQAEPSSERKRKGKETLLNPMRSRPPSVASSRAPSERSSH